MRFDGCHIVIWEIDGDLSGIFLCVLRDGGGGGGGISAPFPMELRLLFPNLKKNPYHNLFINFFL